LSGSLGSVRKEGGIFSSWIFTDTGFAGDVFQVLMGYSIVVGPLIISYYGDIGNC
jgi:hypothetical protein